MHKLYALVSLLFAMGGSLFAQEESSNNGETGVLSDLGPVSVETKPQEVKKPDFNDELDVVHLDKRGNRTIRLERIQAPPKKVIEPQAPISPEAAAAWAEEAARLAAQNVRNEAKMLVVASTTFNRELTRLWWWEEGESFEAWSTIDFNYLGGFTEFQVEGKRYSFLSLHSNSEVEALPEHPPLEAVAQPYASSSSNPAGGMDVPGILHQLYVVEETRLKEAFGRRHLRRLAWEATKQALEEERLKKDVVIRYWPRKTTNYKNLTEEGE